MRCLFKSSSKVCILFYRPKCVTSILLGKSKTFSLPSRTPADMLKGCVVEMVFSHHKAMHPFRSHVHGMEGGRLLCLSLSNVLSNNAVHSGFSEDGGLMRDGLCKVIKFQGKNEERCRPSSRIRGKML